MSALMRPDIFKTPVPAPTIFEWRGHVEHRLNGIQVQLETVARAGPTAVAPAIGATAAPPAEPITDKNFRLVKEIEDEEMAFRRATTKAALDIAKEETDKAIERATRVEKLCQKLEEQMKRMEDTFQKQLDDAKKEKDSLHSELLETQAENKQLKESLDELQKQIKVNEKHGHDLEDALYYLQDEIAKPKPQDKPASPPARGGRPATKPPTKK